MHNFYLKEEERGEDENVGANSIREMLEVSGVQRRCRCGVSVYVGERAYVIEFGRFLSSEALA